MSSIWDMDGSGRIRAFNPTKTENFNPNIFQGENTCVHTLNDDAGPWW